MQLQVKIYIVQVVRERERVRRERTEERQEREREKRREEKEGAKKLPISLPGANAAPNRIGRASLLVRDVCVSFLLYLKWSVPPLTEFKGLTSLHFLESCFGREVEKLNCKRAAH